MVSVWKRIPANPEPLDFTGVFGFVLIILYGEILGLKWDAVDFENGIFSIRRIVTRVHKVIHEEERTKNKHSRSDLPIPIFIKHSLENIMQTQAQNRLMQPNDYIDDGYVFTYVDGKVMHPGYVSKRFTELLKKNGLPHIRFHDLRHSAAGYLKRLKFDLKDIQMWLRHGDISTTGNLYLHFNMEAKNAIADNLNEQFQNFGS